MYNMRQLFKKSSSKKSIDGKNKRPSSRPSSRPASRPGMKKVTKNMTLTELQMIARKRGIQFAGLKKEELYKELINYGIIHA